MSEILTAAQMRAIEEAAIGSGAVTGLELMERAGKAVVAQIMARMPQAGRALVLCGPGNNGGDGFVIARLLHIAGWQVTACIWGEAARLPPDARAMFEAWSQHGATRPLCDLMSDPGDDGPFAAPDVIVDALFGTGLTRPLPEEVTNALQDMEGWRQQQVVAPLVVAVDVPSGLCADTGRVLGRGLAAALTVSFHAPKLGHYLGQGPAICGDLVVADIGLPQRPLSKGVPVDVVRAAQPDIAHLRKAQGHKFEHGHALILSGGVGAGGAARLAARAALRVGAGVVTLACPPAAVIENAARLDAVMLWSLRGAQELALRLGDARIRALCLGPGLGLGARARGLVGAALETPDPAPDHARPRITVLDADALTLIAQDDGLRRLLTPDCVLTPHLGEFSRLAPDLAAGTDLSAVQAARIAADRLGATILLKGAATVIAAPGGAVWINTAVYARAVPWLATAGAGDVLAGMIAGLGARGFDAADAATSAAWLHGEAARAFGPGLIAEDIPEALPGVFSALLGKNG